MSQSVSYCVEYFARSKKFSEKICTIDGIMQKYSTYTRKFYIYIYVLAYSRMFINLYIT